ncbi:MAG: SBBP repeat-containing protein, partial [Chloroflexi bacterium]|nr:SBBP repeat-containing protein [Chloroflexota bacterium]
MGDADAYLRKYDGHGKEIWTQQFGTESEDHATGVTADGAGNLYVVGLTRGVFPGYTGLVGIDYDAYLRKYDGDGNELWTRQFGTPHRPGAQGE